MAEASVLIVDDDRSIVRLCQRLLERAAFKVFASTDPLEAIKILEARKIDMLLSDIRMPVMDGFELIEKAKLLQPELAVLVMTGFGTVDTAIQALYKGVDGLILKPFENTADLVRAAQRVLDGNRQKQDAARAQALRPLFDLTEILLAETSLETLETLVIKDMLELFQSQHAGVYELNPQAAADEARLLMSHGLPAEGKSESWSYLSQYLLNHHGVVQINTFSPEDVELQDALRDMGWGAVMAVPTHRNNASFLFVTARGLDGGTFTASDLELFTILARQTVVAMENARLYTDLRESIHRIEESQLALIQAEKMAAVGRLMASLAHEINNPLQAVRNCLHLANRVDVDDKQRAMYLAMTDNELDRLVNTVRHMLDFYRPGLQEKEAVNLCAAVERVLTLLQSQFENQKITVFMQVDATYPAILGVRDQVQQVFFNLLLNAMDAMEGKEKKQIWIEGEMRENELYIYIEDTGPGVQSEMQARLFEPFVSTKKNGTGLGLSVSYGVVEAHGGRLALVPSRHEQGACFEICFPLQPAE
jgi:signal transduction histidine kinase/FixJ family two-component response regulator